MATAFDPYHRWLSIPPAEQPPNHYRLLGLQPFESSVDVIANASERQVRHVRPHLESPLRPYAANLIRELDVARRCLLNVEEKDAYDSWLEQRFANHENRSANGQRPSRRVKRKRAVPTSGISRESEASVDYGVNAPINFGESFPTHQDTFPTAIGSVIQPTYGHYRKRYKSKNKFFPLAFLILWAAGAIIGLLAGYAVLCMIDPKYDFLNIMFRLNQEIATGNSDGTSRNPAMPLKPTRPKRATADAPNVAVPRVRKIQTPFIPSPQGSGKIDRSADSASPAIQEYRFILPEVLALPTPILEYADQPYVFASLSDGVSFISPHYQFELTLTQGCNHELGSIYVVTSPPTQNEQQWKIRWHRVSQGDQSELDFDEIGHFATKQNELLFTWHPNVPNPAVAAIRNSLLHLKFDENRHSAALRSAEEASSYAISLDREKWVARCRVDDLPNIDAIQVDIAQSPSFPANRVEDGNLHGLRVGDSRLISYFQAQGAATRVTILNRSSRFEIEFRNLFRLPSGREGELTVREGGRVLNQMERELAAARSRLSRTGPDSNMSGKISLLQGDITALREIGVATSKWNDNWPLGFRYYFVVDGREVDLAITPKFSVD